MRQHRQASQETQQRRLLLQRLADRKQGQRVLLDSSSEGDQSDSDASTAQGDGSGTLPATSRVEPPVDRVHKAFKRLSQARPPTQQESLQDENLSGAVNSMRHEQTPQNTKQKPTEHSMAAEDLLSSFSSLSVSKPVRPAVAPGGSFAAALTTQLPDELPAGSSKTAAASGNQSTLKTQVAEESAQPEFRMKPDVESKLYKHQLEGVQWLWSLHKMRRGGILGGS